MSTEGITGSNAASETQANSETEATVSTKPMGNATSMSTAIGNLNKLKDESPEVWKKMLEAMASGINKQQEKHTRKLKEIRREYEKR